MESLVETANGDFFGILKVATELVSLLDKGADRLLPDRIVDVVKLHSKVAAGVAWLPTGFDLAASGANVWTMYVRINNKLGLQIKKNVLAFIAFPCL